MKTTPFIKELSGHLDMVDVVNEMETLLNVKLMARNMDDELNGYVNLIHSFKNDKPISIVEVHLYEEDEDPIIENDSIKGILDNATASLSKTKKQEVINKMSPILGGHTTKFRKPTNLKESHKKLGVWSKDQKNNKIKE